MKLLNLGESKLNEWKCESIDFTQFHNLFKYYLISTDACYSKDARLPVQLQRARAAEAEAAREARAKVPLNIDTFYQRCQFIIRIFEPEFLIQSLKSMYFKA